mmetsp:Transcript_16752/g.18980  ORF Transcript_16752/g.18980 Transcript_16752/m.18980 type:complete len:207 (-) Transcript_16752:192-812(-)|eukprot:CAMPEP_0184023218 /NCGR_PEP_ID=MMETSP0954-20121128/11207_1 /TAXON_ID=627963 /ORGANISM="Aplanochytrium sp, Strain PBS07" /LENGTH=206 /DNA_ID=CAMNT_0026306015 /DNA_START=258 /DNA_END=878 /DNA_ORIENTATION=-
MWPALNLKPSIPGLENVESFENQPEKYGSLHYWQKYPPLVKSQVNCDSTDLAGTKRLPPKSCHGVKTQMRKRRRSLGNDSPKRSSRGQGGGKRYTKLEHVMVIGAICEDKLDCGGIYNSKYILDNQTWHRIFDRMQNFKAKMLKRHPELGSHKRELTCIKRHYKELCSRFPNTNITFYKYHMAYIRMMEEDKDVDFATLPDISVKK